MALDSHGFGNQEDTVPHSKTNQGELNDPMKVADTMTSSSMKKDNHNNIQLDGPLHGAIKKKARDNRDMSEGLEKSRSHKLGGLVSMVDNQADTQSQKDFRVFKKQAAQNVTLDSGGNPTVSGGAQTKCSKHDMSGDATDIAMPGSSGGPANASTVLSHSDHGAGIAAGYKKQPASTVPKTTV